MWFCLHAVASKLILGPFVEWGISLVAVPTSFAGPVLWIPDVSVLCVFVESDSKASPLFLDFILHEGEGAFWPHHSKEAALRWGPRDTTSADPRFEDGLCALESALLPSTAFLWEASLAFSWTWLGFFPPVSMLLVLLWPSIKTWNLSLSPKLPFHHNKLGLLAFCFSIRNEASCPVRSFAGFMMYRCSGANQVPRPGSDTLAFLRQFLPSTPLWSSLSTDTLTFRVASPLALLCSFFFFYTSQTFSHTTARVTFPKT